MTTYVYFGVPDVNGVINTFNGGTISSFDSSYLTRLGQLVQEGVSIPNPSYIQDTTTIIVNAGQLMVPQISFVQRNAAQNNTLGYFIYDVNNVPTNPNQITTRYIVFPNLSAAIPRRIYRPYLQVTTTTSSGFLIINTASSSTTPIGGVNSTQRIGFFLIANGWNGVAVDTSQQIYWSISALNPETTNKGHVAILTGTPTTAPTLCFEDMNRDTNSDNDFNDAVIFFATNLPLYSNAIITLTKLPP